MTTAFGTMPDLPGGQAEAMAVPFADLFALPIPEGITDEEAVLLTDILPTGYLGALRASIPAGRHRRHHGSRTSRDHGAAVRVALRPGPHPRRGRGARAAGPRRAPRRRADRRPDRARIGSRCSRPPADGALESVIEAVGADATIVDAVSCAAPGGTVSVVGVNLTMDLPFPMAIVFLKSLTLRAVFAPIPGTWSLPRPAAAVRPSDRPGRDVHPPDGPGPGARGLRVVRLAGRRRLEGLAHAAKP